MRTMRTRTARVRRDVQPASEASGLARPREAVEVAFACDDGEAIFIETLVVYFQSTLSLNVHFTWENGLFMREIGFMRESMVLPTLNGRLRLELLTNSLEIDPDFLFAKVMFVCRRNRCEPSRLCA